MKRNRSTRPFAKRSLGQNFLADPSYIDKIVSAVGPSPYDSVIEIGPGRGALTEQLLESGAQVTAIELDRDLGVLLTDKFGRNANFRLIVGNILETDLTDLTADRERKAEIGSVKVVGNLPYNISTAILQKVIEERAFFSEAVLMFQKEVTERIMANPGSSHRGFLTVLADAYLEISELLDVPPDAFRPRPKVWSSVVRLRPKRGPIIDPKEFRTLVSQAFGQKRKTLLNNLKGRYADAAAKLADVGIEPSRRAETLTVDEWTMLTTAIGPRS